MNFTMIENQLLYAIILNHLDNLGQVPKITGNNRTLEKSHISMIGM